MVPLTRFTELLNDIEPSPTTKSNSSNAHSSVRNFLKTHESFRDHWESDFLSGSYARDTAIRPRKSEDGTERPDVDIIVVTNFSTSDKPDDVLDELAKSLANAYTVDRINKRSVRLTMSYAEVDVVPVIEYGQAYQIPDRDLDSWKLTNPPAHTEWSSTQNTAFDGRFKPLVKLFKWWKRENPTGKRPKGFVLEVLVSKHAPIGEKHYGEAITQVLESIYSAYGSLAEGGTKPYIEDPGLPGNDILSKVSITDWKKFIERIRVHSNYARSAQDTDDMEEATRLWQKLFGDRFKPTEKSAAGERLMTDAIAPAVAITGYTFPNVSAAPTKPRGFA